MDHACFQIFQILGAIYLYISCMNACMYVVGTHWNTLQGCSSEYHNMFSSKNEKIFVETYLI